MRMMTRLGGGVLAVVMLLAMAPLLSQETMRIRPLIENKHVVVSFELNDAYSGAVREAIVSGLRTTFTYELELRTPAWIDRTIATTIVSARDEYDNLTRRHTLTRTVEGRIEAVVVTDDEAVVKAWLTKWDRVPVAETAGLDASRDYYVRVTTHMRPSGDSFLGLAKTITAQVKFTFIP